MDFSNMPLPRESAGLAEHPRSKANEGEVSRFVVSDLPLHTFSVDSVGFDTPNLDVPAVGKEVSTAAGKTRYFGLDFMRNAVKGEPVVNAAFVDRADGVAVDTVIHLPAPTVGPALNTGILHDGGDRAIRYPVHLADSDNAHSLVNVEALNGGRVWERDDLALAPSDPGLRTWQSIAVKPHVDKVLRHIPHLRNGGVRVILNMNQSIQRLFVRAKSCLHAIFESQRSAVNAKAFHPARNLRLGNAVHLANISRGKSLRFVKVGEGRRKGARIQHEITSRSDRSRMKTGQGYRDVSGSKRVISPLLALSNYTSLAVL